MNTNKIGLVGIIIGILATSAAFLSPWITRAISPPKPIEQSAVEFASRLKDAALAKAKGEEYRPIREDKKDLGEMVPIGVIGLGMIGMTLGVVSLVKRERKLVGGLAIGFGITSAIVQWSLLIAGTLILLILVAIVLNALDIDIV